MALMKKRLAAAISRFSREQEINCPALLINLYFPVFEDLQSTRSGKAAYLVRDSVGAASGDVTADVTVTWARDRQRITGT